MAWCALRSALSRAPSEVRVLAGIGLGLGVSTGIVGAYWFTLPDEVDASTVLDKPRWPPKLRACDCTGLASTVPPGPRRCPEDTPSCPAAVRQRASRLRGRLRLQATCANHHACAGTCCNSTPWPLGMVRLGEQSEWHRVEPVC